MLKNASSAKIIFTTYVIDRSLTLAPRYVYKRTLSTNSAIRKGLRKATHSRSRLDPPARVGGFIRKRADVNHGQISGFRGRGSRPKSRHLADEDAPLARRTREIPVKRREGSEAPQRMYNSPDQTQRYVTRGAVSARDRGGKARTKITTSTRAERRAALFGHKENPPEGYKGLPSISPIRQRSPQDSQEARPRRLASSRPWRREGTDFKRHGDQRNSGNDFIFNGASRNPGDEHRWADSPTRRQGLEGSKERSSDLTEERPRRKINAPLAIPYTTPASEFLYGHSVVTMALKSSRRTFYKLYLYDGDAAEVRGQDKQVRKLALAANVEVTRVGKDWIKLMDKMSGGRPHNGYILEASPLPRLPITGLMSVPNPQSTTRPTFNVILDHQSREEAAVNGTNTAISFGTGNRRYPFLLLLDGIKDPGNIGAIIRSSHFLGADGILICTRNSAALTPVALKAAAGGAETLPLFSVGQPGSFIDESQENGWKFYAAVSPSSSDGGRVTGRPYFSSTTLGHPLQKHPCILVLGGEGDGLRWNIQKKADFLLGIEAQRTGSGELDSLNVSVASALLCDAFLRSSNMTNKARKRGQDELPNALEGDLVKQNVDLAYTSQSERGDLAVEDKRMF
ncbi:MAG: hypothetical protein Q9209_000495 [Squamulea sp. 1 TL-2023]